MLTDRATELEQLRDGIERLDRALVEVIAERLRWSRTAIELRVGMGQRLTDPAQERRVRARARQWAKELGVSPALVDRVLRTLIAEGKKAHRRPIAPKVPRLARSEVRSDAGSGRPSARPWVGQVPQATPSR